MKEILRNMIQKVQRECNRRENKRRLMSMVAMLCVFSIVSTSVMQSSMIQVAANARTGSNAIETSSNVATPSDADNDVSGGMTGGTSSGMAEVQTPSNTTEVQTSSNATVATSSNATYEGILICGIDDEGHVHEESCYCTDVEVANVILMIHELPTADEIDATLLAYEEDEDWEGYEEYFVYIGSKGRRAYEAYEELTEEQKALVFNIDKLMEWDYIWSAATLIDEINSDTPTTAKAASTSAFIDLNLYDYTGKINDKYFANDNTSFYGYSNSKGWHTKYTGKYPGFQWNGGAYLNGTYDRHVVDYIDFGNSKITDYDYAGYNYGKSTTSTDIVINDNWVRNYRNANLGIQSTLYKNINLIDVDIDDAATGTDYGVTNRPVGMSLNSSISDTNYDILQRTLKNGYPALADGTSLAYLFKNDSGVVNKQNSSSIDGLFQQNTTTGEYYYNSRWNHAQYNDDTETFTLYNQIITPNFIVYPFGNFLPFNDITKDSKATQVSKITNVRTYVDEVIEDLKAGAEDATENQLIHMLDLYRDDIGSSWTASKAIKDYFTTNDSNADNPSDDTSQIDSTLLAKMYNIDWDVDTNFFFGMDMTMNFIQPKGGMTGNDTNKDGNSDYPMVFYFTGDDDVWVYIDDVLFLDLTGIHRHVGGEIDFVNGKVNYYALDTEGTGDVSKNPYKTYTFKELLSAAGKSTSGLNSKGTFKDYTSHEFKFFYMERGSGSSVCRLNFNFPLLRRNTISVEKELTSDGDTAALGNPDFMFQVLKANSDGTKTSNKFIGANVSYNIYEGNTKVGTGKTDSNGVITIKAGQRAEFTDIKEDAGKFYVRELLTTDAFNQYGTIAVDGSSVTSSNNVTVGSDTFKGVESSVKDASDGATVFHFNNNITFNKLGHLEIKKTFTPYPNAGSSTPTTDFEFKVLLSGEAIPKGTKYTVNDETRTVETVGIIKVPAGKIATISNIIAGTTFSVVEEESSANNYSVTYIDASGTIKTDTTSKVTVTNAELGAEVKIPLEKILTNADGGTYSYTLKLEQCNSIGETISGGYTDEVTISFDSEDRGTVAEKQDIIIYYLSKNIPDTGSTFYYKIYENESDSSNVDCDESIYLVTVKVTKDSSTNKITVSEPVITKKGEPASKASFTNTLLSSISIRKEVDGSLGDRAKKFDFIATAVAGIFVKENITGECTVNADGSQITFQLAHGEELAIGELPLGTEITVKENYTQGENETIAYTVKVAQGSTIVNGDTMRTTIVATNEKIIFTNTKEARPDTGILLDSWPYLLILAIALAGIVGFVIHKRKETDLD